MADDYISRQDAVSRFSDLLMVELKGKRLPTWDEVYNAMQDVPSADAQPKDEVTKAFSEKMELTLNSPLTEEDLDKIYDVDMDNTSAVTFYTKHGKDVKFVKQVMCKDCKHSYVFEPWEGINATRYCKIFKNHYGDSDFCVNDDDFCSYGERKDEQDG